MYTLTTKLKVFAIVLMVLGAVFTAIGFLNAPADEAAVEQMLADEAAAHGEGHGEAHEAIDSDDNTHDVATGHETNGHEASEEVHMETGVVTDNEVAHSDDAHTTTPHAARIMKDPM